VKLPVSQTNTEVLATGTVVLAALTKTIKDIADEHRRELDTRMARGSKLTAMDRSPRRHPDPGQRQFDAGSARPCAESLPSA
jgi:hypothetical protein